MKWFNRIDKQRMEFIQSYIPTSKAQLIQVAMWYHRGDTAKAQEFVDFYTKNMTIPDFDPIQPSTMQQLKESASGIYAWIKENQGDLLQGYQLIHSIIKNKGSLPDLSSLAAAPSGASTPPLPEIN